MHGFAGERQPQREQDERDLFASQPDRDLTRSRPRPPHRPVRLRHERLRSKPGRRAQLRFPLRHVGSHHRIRHVGHAVLVEQPVIDPLHRVPLLARRAEILPQNRVDHRLERVQLRRPARIAPALRWPRRRQRLLHRAPPDVVLALDRPPRQPGTSVPADRGVELHLRHRRHERSSAREARPSCHRKQPPDVKIHEHQPTPTPGAARLH